jgi:hypothetical protein
MIVLKVEDSAARLRTQGMAQCTYITTLSAIGVTYCSKCLHLPYCHKLSPFALLLPHTPVRPTVYYFALLSASLSYLPAYYYYCHNVDHSTHVTTTTTNITTMHISYQTVKMPTAYQQVVQTSSECHL